MLCSVIEHAGRHLSFQLPYISKNEAKLSSFVQFEKSYRALELNRAHLPMF